MDDINQVEEKIGIKFLDKQILKLALVHRSYLNETKEKSIESNERLEFLGDAVLQFLSSKYIYLTQKDFAEGDLTNLRARVVNTESLAAETDRLNLVDHIFISKGERNVAKDSDYILANLFESIIGAIYLDQGLDVCEEFLHKHLFYKIADIVKDGTLKDPKSLYQEHVQEIYNTTPNYTLISEDGPDHSKQFKIGVYVNSHLTGIGVGSSKRKAEQEAAKNALNKSSNSG